jgi:hypothetical protein
MDLEGMLKQAVLAGLAAGVIVTAAVLLWSLAQTLLRPAATVAAAVTAGPGFGFQPPA